MKSYDELKAEMETIQQQLARSQRPVRAKNACQDGEIGQVFCRAARLLGSVGITA